MSNGAITRFSRSSGKLVEETVTQFTLDMLLQIARGPKGSKPPKRGSGRLSASKTIKFLRDYDAFMLAVTGACQKLTKSNDVFACNFDRAFSRKRGSLIDSDGDGEPNVAECEAIPTVSHSDSLSMPQIQGILMTAHKLRGTRV